MGGPCGCGSCLPRDPAWHNSMGRNHQGRKGRRRDQGRDGPIQQADSRRSGSREHRKAQGPGLHRGKGLGPGVGEVRACVQREGRGRSEGTVGRGQVDQSPGEGRAHKRLWRPCDKCPGPLPLRHLTSILTTPAVKLTQHLLVISQEERKSLTEKPCFLFLTFINTYFKDLLEK